MNWQSYLAFVIGLDLDLCGGPLCVRRLDATQTDAPVERFVTLGTTREQGDTSPSSMGKTTHSAVTPVMNLLLDFLDDEHSRAVWTMNADNLVFLSEQKSSLTPARLCRMQ